jgi:hypothetical protein
LPEGEITPTIAAASSRGNVVVGREHGAGEHEQARSEEQQCAGVRNGRRAS